MKRRIVNVRGEKQSSNYKLGNIEFEIEQYASHYGLRVDEVISLLKERLIFRKYIRLRSIIRGIEEVGCDISLIAPDEIESGSVGKDYVYSDGAYYDVNNDQFLIKVES